MTTVLNQIEANHRSNSIKSGLEYNFYFHLQKGKAYNGMVHVTATFTKTNNLFMDFAGKNILSLQLNSHPEIDVTKDPNQLFKNGKLHLPEAQLKIGENSIMIRFTNEYNTDGNGLHTFTDTDGQQYVYCQTEPYWLNRVTPLFDQPDLKGTNKFHILCPKDWTVVANEVVEREYKNHHDFAAENRIKSPFQNQIMEHYFSSDFQQNDQSFSIFKQSKLLSTYLFCIVAGPYEKHSLPESKRYNNIVMNYYCRKSKSKYGIPQSEFSYDVLIKGIQFFENFFGVPFPFEKWDFIMCPEFTVGAMEFPGCVTFNDLKFIYEGDEVPAKFNAFVVRVILHELAHMWFGNLVTMKWWDGLWLNESFADFSAFLCLMKIHDKLAVQIEDPIISIYSRKLWGYEEDSKSTTHPIACEICDTNKADSIFDGITYSKGMATLMQLYHRIGFEQFSANLSNYMNEFKWKNTEMMDLFRHLENGIDSINMKEWIQEWLLSSGTNSMQPEWDHSKQGKQIMKIHQGAVMDMHPTLRQHLFDMTFFNKEGNAVYNQTVDVSNQEISEIEIDNKDYAAVLLNSTDKGFIQVRLDDSSLEFFKKNLWKIEDYLMKSLLFEIFLGEIRQGKLRADVLVNIVDQILTKTDLTNPKSSKILMDLPLLLKKCFLYIPALFRISLKKKIFESAWKAGNILKENDTLGAIKEILILTASVKDDILTLSDLLDESKPFRSKYLVSIRDESSIHTKILGCKEIPENLQKRILEFYEQDNLDDIFANNKLEIDALLANEKGRSDLWKKEYFNKDRTLSYFRLQFSMKGFTSAVVGKEKKSSMMKDFFNDIIPLLETDTKEIGKTVLEGLCPTLDDDMNIIEKINNLLIKIKSLGNQFYVDFLQMKIDKYIEIQNAYKLFK